MTRVVPDIRRKRHGGAPASSRGVAPSRAYGSVLEEARRTGLLNGEKSEHVSFRAPPALVEAAKRQSGVTSTSELGVLALAVLAQPDPVVGFMRRARGRLGRDHTLEF